MKQKRAILFFFIYLFSLSGLMVKFHFCSNELDSWNISLQNNSTEDNSCCCDGMDSFTTSMDCMDEEDKDCCDDQEIIVKTTSDYLQFSSKSLVKFDLFNQAILPVFSLDELLIKNQVVQTIRINDPPLFKVKSTPKYIQYSRLLFYA